ncbi:MAG: AAA domain-containing protein [Deltaproteobacteria bacterium]|nr:AAA domain-containing protein [Deltaproteobacteria bacterium]
MRPQELIDAVSDLNDIAGVLNNSFVAREEVVEMLLIGAIAQEHLLLAGPPGTGKSELVKQFAQLSTAVEPEDGTTPYFEYLLTRFTEPNELFGPVDIRTFQEGGGYRRLIKGLLPTAELAFLDEIFKANSAILNALLTILNERLFYNGGRPESIPLLFLVGATNEVPEDPELAALYDRFPIRLWTDNVDESRFDELLQCGWRQERRKIRDGGRNRLGNLTDSRTLRRLNAALKRVDLSPIRRAFTEVIRRIRAEGIEISDRRAIKMFKLVAAAALRRGSLEAGPSDFHILRHCWNRRDQAIHLEAILETYLEDKATGRGPGRQFETLEAECKTLEEQSRQLDTDIDLADFLHQAERLRRELAESTDPRTLSIRERLEGLIDTTLEQLSD